MALSEFKGKLEKIFENVTVWPLREETKSVSENNSDFINKTL
jgi:hypothetical protein